MDARPPTPAADNGEAIILGRSGGTVLPGHSGGLAAWPVGRSSGTAAPVIIGLSGGVDSAVAAALLGRAGVPTRALFMKNWEDDDRDGHCASAADLIDAVAVAERLDLDIDQVNFAAEYRERVFARFLAEYAAGRTPNPDILCNSEIKFAAFLHTALARGAERIATGHYARTIAWRGQHWLLKGTDNHKDQSYFLHRLDQAQLARSLFPLGHREKTEVRRLARELALPVAEKPDSTGICFIGERPLREFLARYLTARHGPIEDVHGRVLGTHAGVHGYTLGQREGLGIGGQSGGSGEPWYVVDKDVARGALVVAQGSEHPRLYCRALAAVEPHWIVVPPRPGFACFAKTRYRQSDQACRIEVVADDRLVVRFAEPQRAVTPGQSVVFYAGELCLGGAVISERL